MHITCNKTFSILTISVILTVLVSGCIKEDLSWRKSKKIRIQFSDYGITGSLENPSTLTGVPAEDAKNTKVYVIDNKNNILVATQDIPYDNILNNKVLTVGVPGRTDTATIIAWTRLNNKKFLFKEPKVGTVINKDELISLQKEVVNNKYTYSPPSLCAGLVKVNFNKRDTALLAMRIKTQSLQIETKFEPGFRKLNDFYYEITSPTNSYSFKTEKPVNKDDALFRPNIKIETTADGCITYETKDNLVKGSAIDKSKENSFTIFHMEDAPFTIHLMEGSKLLREVVIDPKTFGDAAWKNNWDKWQDNPAYYTLKIKFQFAKNGNMTVQILIADWDINYIITPFS